MHNRGECLGSCHASVNHKGGALLPIWFESSWAQEYSLDTVERKIPFWCQQLNHIKIHPRGKCFGNVNWLELAAVWSIQWITFHTLITYDFSLVEVTCGPDVCRYVWDAVTCQHLNSLTFKLLVAVVLTDIVNLVIHCPLPLFTGCEVRVLRSLIEKFHRLWGQGSQKFSWKVPHVVYHDGYEWMV
jgi:hypothetical protein